MPPFEVLYRIGDNPGLIENGAWKDGMPVSALPEGEAFTTSELNAWIGTYGTGVLGAEPTGFDSIPEERQRHIRRRMKQLNYLLHPQVQSENESALEQLRVLRFGPPPPAYEMSRQQEIILRMVREAGFFKDKILQYGGMDTNWGFRDLMHCGVILIDLSYRQLTDNISTITSESEHPLAQRRVIARCGWRVKYEQIYTQQRIDNLRNRGILVPVDRGTVYTPAQALERVTLT